MIAAIGLDPGRRERASALLQGKVRNRSFSSRRESMGDRRVGAGGSAGPRD